MVYAVKPRRAEPSSFEEEKEEEAEEEEETLVIMKDVIIHLQQTLPNYNISVTFNYPITRHHLKPARPSNRKSCAHSLF